MNVYFSFIIGAATGWAITYLVMRYGSKIYSLGEQLYKRAEGDVAAARSHISLFRKGL